MKFKFAYIYNYDEIISCVIQMLYLKYNNNKKIIGIK